MDWILEHFNLVVIIALVVGSLVKSRFDAAKENSEDEVAGDFGRPDKPDDSYRKKQRPTPTVPPPLPKGQIPATRTAQPVFSTDTAKAAAAEEAARVLKHQQDLAAHLQQIRENKAATSGGAAATRERVASKGNKAKSTKSAPLTLRSRLKSPAEVRRAFVMREILDRPVGLR